MASSPSNGRKLTAVMENIMTGFELAYLLDKYAVTFKDPAIYTC